MIEEFAIYKVARRMIRDHGSQAVAVAFDVAELPYLKKDQETKRLWLQIAHAAAHLLGTAPPTSRCIH